MQLHAQEETSRAATAVPLETAATAAPAASAASAESGSRHSCRTPASRQTTARPASLPGTAARGAAPPPRCARSGSAARKDRSPPSGRCGTALSCTWGGAVSCAALAFHVQTGIYHRICKHQLLRRVCKVRSCIC